MKHRLRAAYAALLGRPVIYRAHIEGTLVIDTPKSVVFESRLFPYVSRGKTNAFIRTP